MIPYGFPNPWYWIEWARSQQHVPYNLIEWRKVARP